jgi:hypothetical protein
MASQSENAVRTAAAQLQNLIPHPPLGSNEAPAMARETIDHIQNAITAMLSSSTPLSAREIDGRISQLNALLQASGGSLQYHAGDLPGIGSLSLTMRANGGGIGNPQSYELNFGAAGMFSGTGNPSLHYNAFGSNGGRPVIRMHAPSLRP